MNKLLQSKRVGSAMALVLLAVVVLLVMGTGLMSLGMHSRLFSVQTAAEITARCAADAGLTRALFSMNRKLKVKPWDDSTLPHATYERLPNCDAVLSYAVIPDGDGNYTIESLGTSGRAQRKVNAALRLQGLFEYAVFTQGPMILRNGTTVDWYNYDVGEESLQIGTNSIEANAIDSKTGVTINGDVLVGVGGDPDSVIDSKNEAVITGDTYALTEEHQLPSITVPLPVQQLPSQGPITGTTTLTGPAKYDSIDLGNNEIITIDGQVSLYVAGDIILDNSAQLQILSTNPDASLTLYLGGNFVSRNGGIINNLAQDATKLKIYGLDSCRSIDFGTGGSFYGAIYAPNADIRLHNSVDMFGAVVGNSFAQDVFAAFYYDASLRDAAVNDEGARFVVKRWREE